MGSRFSCLLLVLAFSIWPLAWSQDARSQSASRSGGNSSNDSQRQTGVPTGVILVKGARSSASDSITPLPEDGRATNNVYSNRYFGITYPFPPDWTEKYKGPPPSDSGGYVLAQLTPEDTFKGPARGSILITAQDVFFTPLPAANALELIRYEKDHLQADYKVELPPRQSQIAGHSFVFFAYWSPAAELHWYVLATQIRCHALKIVLSSRDTKLLESLILDMNKMHLPAEAGSTAGTGGGDFPVCLKNYARGDNVIAKADPVFAEPRLNPVPVRITIDTQGHVKHIHYLSAFPDQAQAITEALEKWKFKPYLQDGRPVEVETGIMFGRAR
jgi:hypothetical protein